LGIEQASEFLNRNLPAKLRMLLAPLALHDVYLDLDYLEEMARRVRAPIDRAEMNLFAKTLETAQLLLDCGQSIYQISPTLATALHVESLLNTDAWAKVFVEAMGSVAEALAGRSYEEQKAPYQVYARNFYSALRHAERLRMDAEALQLTHGLAVWEMNSGRYEDAEKLYATLTRHPAHRANAYHQLGRIAQTRRNPQAALEWYRMSLSLNEPAGNHVAVADTWLQLGIMAREKRDFNAAEDWFRKTITIRQSQGDDDGAASAYHELGIVYEQREDTTSAERWYYRALATKEKSGDESATASIYHHLGMLALKKNDTASAERWFNKSLGIRERLQQDSASQTYHQLGLLACQKEDWLSADNWFRKSLDISERTGDAPLSAANAFQLGRLTVMQGQLVAAGRWLIRSIQIFRSTDAADMNEAVSSFAEIHRQAPLASKTQLEELWRAARLGGMPG